MYIFYVLDVRCYKKKQPSNFIVLTLLNSKYGLISINAFKKNKVKPEPDICDIAKIE